MPLLSALFIFISIFINYNVTILPTSQLSAHPKRGAKKCPFAPPGGLFCEQVLFTRWYWSFWVATCCLPASNAGAFTHTHLTYAC